MYNVSAAYTTAAEANARQILVRALFNDTTELTGDNIIDMTLTEATNASGGLSMGTTISSKLTMTLKMPETPLLLNGGYVAPGVGYYGANISDAAHLEDDGTLVVSPTPEIGSDGTMICETAPTTDGAGVLIFSGGNPITEYCPLGEFYITEAVSKNDFKTVFTITAYDKFCKTEIPYSPTIAMPNTARAILEDIATQCNFKLASNIQCPNIVIDFYDWTCRQYIGYIAGLAGKNARFNRNGYLTFIWYTDSGYSVSRNVQYMSGFKRLTSDDFVVSSITSGSSDNVLTSGTGFGISFDNPLMTQDRLNDIFEDLGTFSYTPAQVKWRGNPAIEVGDIIVADDSDGISHRVYVMEQTIKISGGLYSEIKCYGDSEAAMNFETSPQAKKLQQVYTKLQEAIKNATAVLNGANGGIFEIIDEDGDEINDGWIIHSADGQKFIKANVNGIGITTDGGTTYQQAMTADGINASTITTGQMNAQRLTVGDTTLGDVFSVELDEEGHPVVTIGSSQNDIVQKQTNDAIEFVNGAEDQVAKFSTTGAEWADMQQMKYCGFIWTRSATTGNVRFTKAVSE